MDASLRPLVDEVKEGLRALYGSRLEGVYIFGSRVRGYATEESDLDVLVVLNRVQDYAAEIARTSRLVSETSLRHGITVSRVFFSRKDWHDASTVFAQNLREEVLVA